jgi:hypothetical protein
MVHFSLDASKYFGRDCLWLLGRHAYSATTAYRRLFRDPLSHSLSVVLIRCTTAGERIHVVHVRWCFNRVAGDVLNIIYHWCIGTYVYVCTPRSPVFHPLNFCVWGYLKALAYSQRRENSRVMWTPARLSTNASGLRNGFDSPWEDMPMHIWNQKENILSICCKWIYLGKEGFTDTHACTYFVLLRAARIQSLSAFHSNSVYCHITVESRNDGTNACGHY